jgi:hypothetical protein
VTFARVQLACVSAALSAFAVKRVAAPDGKGAKEILS